MNTPSAPPSSSPDTQPPTIAVTAPGPQHPAGIGDLTATAGDAGTGVGGYEFQIDGVNVGPAINVAVHRVREHRRLANGAHWIGAYA
jgi:hypothetical protein